MAAPDKPEGFRRVLVALDSSAASSAALEVAAGVAASQACELSGLFVEDEDLLRLAGLPFAREIQLARAMSRTLAPEQLLRDLRAQARIARAAMARQAAQHRVSWSFEVIQGRGEEAILMAAARGDIIAMSRGFGALANVRGLSRRLRLIAARAPGPLLLAGMPPDPRPGPVLLPYDASPAAEAMLGLATGLARAAGRPLEIVLLGDAAGRGAELEARLRRGVGQPSPALRLWPARDDAAVLRRLLEADRGLLVLPADAPWLDPDRVEQIIERARVPVILQTDQRPSS